MKTARAPAFRKTHEVTLCGYRVCTVDAFGVRESSAEAEEFTLVGTRIDGLLVRCCYKTDYAEGGHYVVYPWVATREIWLARDTDPRELPFILAHEYLEPRMMRDGGFVYDQTHEMAAGIEFDFPRGKSDLPVASGRRVRKSDVAALLGPDVFDFVRKNYLR